MRIACTIPASPQLTMKKPAIWEQRCLQTGFPGYHTMTSLSLETLELESDGGGGLFASTFFSPTPTASKDSFFSHQMGLSFRRLHRARTSSILLSYTMSPSLAPTCFYWSLPYIFQLPRERRSARSITVVNRKGLQYLIARDHGSWSQRITVVDRKSLRLPLIAVTSQLTVNVP